MSDIDVKKENGVYVVFVNGIYWCTCETLKDVGEKLEDMEDG